MDREQSLLEYKRRICLAINHISCHLDESLSLEEIAAAAFFSMNVEVKELPSRHVAYVRRIGPYGPEVCGDAHQRLMQWAGPRGLATAEFSIGISWDNPEVTPADKCRYDACLPVPEGTPVDGEVGLQSLGGGRYAVYRVTVGTDGFGQAWEDLMGGWLPRSGYQCADGPCFEICYNPDHAAGESRWEVEICCPVEPL